MGRAHGVPSPRPFRPDGQRDLVRQLDHPRLPGRGGRRRRLRAGRPRRGHHHLRHRRRVRRHPRRGGARPGAEGRAPRGPGDLHQGLLADRARPATTAACPASTSWSRSTARCAGCRPTTSTSTRRTATTTATPLEETMQAFADIVHSGKALYIGVSEWTASQIRAGWRAGPGAEDPARLQPAAVLDAVAGHRGRGRADAARSWASARSSGRRSRRAC